MELKCSTINNILLSVDRDAQHNISLSEISGAVSGALTYLTAGEISPRLTLENNRIINNCRQLYGNFSTCEAAIKLDVQNMQTFHFQVILINSVNIVEANWPNSFLLNISE